MPNKTLIIAGMHRSGTSLITHWLNECGLQVGENLLGAGLGNVEGHFEDIEFLKLHEEILIDNHLPSTGLTEAHNIPVSIYHKEKLKSIIRVKNNLYDQWGWKDPRTCLFLDTYKELIPDARYLIIVRDYKSVVSSLLQRDFKNFEKKYLARPYLSRLYFIKFQKRKRIREFYNDRADHYIKVWIAYNEEILKSVQTMPRHAYVMLNYTMLKANDESVCAFLSKRWNLSLKYFKFKEVYKEKMISQHINPDEYVLNKSLIKKAISLQKELEDYMVLM
jgi:hypothetical protein